MFKNCRVINDSKKFRKNVPQNVQKLPCNQRFKNVPQTVLEYSGKEKEHRLVQKQYKTTKQHHNLH